MQIFNISYRSSEIFLSNHQEYLVLTGIREIPSFQILSRRAILFDLHAINREIVFLYSMKECAAVDSFKIHTCKYSTAMGRKYWGKYRDTESGWSKTTKGWSYGRKCHISLDINSLLIMEWIVSNGNVYDSKVSHDLVGSVRNFSYILADSVYDTSGIYDYVYENTHSIPVIDTNKRIGIVPERLSVDRRIGFGLRKEYAFMYCLRWVIERTFSILEEIMKTENIWYVRNRDYDTAMGLKVIAYNLIVLSNMKSGEKTREIKKFVVC